MAVRGSDVVAGTGRGEAGGVAVASHTGPRERRPTMVIIGVALVVAAALAGAVVFGTLTSTVTVLAAADDIEPGQVITEGDLQVVELSELGDAAVMPVAEQSRIVGQAARGPIPAGTILNRQLFVAADQVVPPGLAIVGASLDPGAAAGSRLRPGDRVDVLGVAATGSGLDQGNSDRAQVLADGTVWAVESPSPGSAGRIVVTVLVPIDKHVEVAQAAADDRLRLAIVSR